MHYSAIFIIPLVAIVSSTVIPSFESSNFTLAKRGSTDVPAECVFTDARTNPYAYQVIKNVDEKGGKACIGWRTDVYSICQNNWGDSDFTEIQNAVNEQVTKDGLFKSSQSGKWSAGFLFPTSAFSNRDTHAFGFVLAALLIDNSPASKSRGYFWSRDGDTLEVSRLSC